EATTYWFKFNPLYKSMWFDNGKLVFISFTNQQMENQSRPSLAMFISDDKISSTDIDEFLASFDPDKYRIFHDPRYKFLPSMSNSL
ncbi:TPA: hypothetical protein ACFPVB_002126, partial [Neisseria meningitidis]